MPTRIAKTLAEVVKFSNEFIRDFGAVVVKILSRDIAYKTEVGGLSLNLQSADEARSAASAMHTRVTAHVPKAHIDGWIVQPMIRRPQAREFTVGMRVDETFGPVITLGVDGRAAEELRDTAHALAPLDLDLARSLIHQTRTFRLLSGSRDGAPVEIDTLAQMLVRLSFLIGAHPEIRQLEINPLLVDGQGEIALSTHVRIADEAREPRVPMCIGP